MTQNNNNNNNNRRGGGGYNQRPKPGFMEANVAIQNASTIIPVKQKELPEKLLC